MKVKNLITLTILFVCLAGLIFVKHITKEDVATEEILEAIVDPKIDIEEIDRVRIFFENNDKELELTKEEDLWKEKNRGLFADKKVLDSFITGINGLQGEARSQNADLFQDYGIQDKEGLHIALSKGENEIKHIVLGTNKPEGSRVFVRSKESNNVYSAESGLLNELGFWREVKSENLNTEKWIDKHLFHTDPDKISGLKIMEKKDNSEIKLVDVERKSVDERKKWEMQEEESFVISATKIKEYLKSLMNVTFSKAIDKEEGHFDNDIMEIELLIDDGDKITVKRGDKDQKEVNYYIEMSGFECLFLMPINKFKNIVRTNGDFFVDNPLGIEKREVKEIKGNLAEEKRNIDIVKDQEDQKKWIRSDGGNVEEGSVDSLLKELRSLVFATWEKDKEPKNKIASLMIMLSDKEWGMDIFESVTINSKGYNPVILKEVNKKYYIETGKTESILEAAKKI